MLVKKYTNHKKKGYEEYELIIAPFLYNST